MELECITLSYSMHNLIATRGVIQETNDRVFNKTLEEPILRTQSKTFAKIHQSLVYEDNPACLKFSTMPKIFIQTKHITTPYRPYIQGKNHGH